MRMCDLSSSLGRLQRLTIKLKDHWHATQEHWSDETARQFQEQYLESLVPQIATTVTATQRLVELLEQAERELDDEMHASF